MAGSFSQFLLFTWLCVSTVLFVPAQTEPLEELRSDVFCRWHSAQHPDVAQHGPLSTAEAWEGGRHVGPRVLAWQLLHEASTGWEAAAQGHRDTCGTSPQLPSVGSSAAVPTPTEMARTRAALEMGTRSPTVQWPCLACCCRATYNPCLATVILTMVIANWQLSWPELHTTLLS